MVIFLLRTVFKRILWGLYLQHISCKYTPKKKVALQQKSGDSEDHDCLYKSIKKLRYSNPYLSGEPTNPLINIAILPCL